MFTIGCHLSSAHGYLSMLQDAVSIGATTFQFFTRNPRGGAAKAQDPADEAAFRTQAPAQGVQLIMAHAPYTLNPCSADPHIRDFAWRTMADDLRRLEAVPHNLYVFHPGSHVGQGAEVGIRYTTDFLNQSLSHEQSTTVLLETMSGKGSEIGRNFTELAAIIKGVTVQSKIGVCLDTCHIYDGGYDIVNQLDEVLADFDRTIGLDKLRAVHLNDSKNPFSSHKDRHAPLGEGSLGADFFVRAINHPLLRDLPFFLETPHELPGYAQEIAWLRAQRQA